jgi:hypothetical protein
VLLHLVPVAQQSLSPLNEIAIAFPFFAASISRSIVMPEDVKQVTNPVDQVTNPVDQVTNPVDVHNLLRHRAFPFAPHCSFLPFREPDICCAASIPCLAAAAAAAYAYWGAIHQFSRIILNSDS